MIYIFTNKTVQRLDILPSSTANTHPNLTFVTGCFRDVATSFVEVNCSFLANWPIWSSVVGTHGSMPSWQGLAQLGRGAIYGRK